MALICRAEVLKHRLTNLLCEQYRVVHKKDSRSIGAGARIQSYPARGGADARNEMLQMVRRAQSTGDAFDLASQIGTEAGITSLPSLVPFLTSLRSFNFAARMISSNHLWRVDGNRIFWNRMCLPLFRMAVYQGEYVSTGQTPQHMAEPKASICQTCIVSVVTVFISPWPHILAMPCSPPYDRFPLPLHFDVLCRPPKMIPIPGLQTQANHLC